jgi:murein DD-endopeptidase MepM/ murein hydrolase activator NlpD
VVVALAVGLVCALMPAAPASAYHRDRQRELERLIAEKQAAIARAEARERDLLARLNASDARRDQLERQLASIGGRLANARARLSLIEARLDTVLAQLRANTARLEQTLGQLQHYTTVLNSRVAGIYMDAPTRYQAAFEAVRNIGDLVAASEYTASVIRADEQLIDAIRRTKESLQTQRIDIAAKQAQLQADRAEAAKETQHIADIHAEHANARAAVQREIDYRQHLLSNVRDQKAEYRRAIASYEAESQSISAFLRGAQSGQQVIQGRGGWLKWPVSGRITSGYGWRTHPIYGYRSFHTGIDIGAPMGTTVKAARRGTVLYTGYRGAYGLIVLVDHGSSVATLYAHLSQTYVRAGERVATLERIAAVGSTGWSTGPHLHFEVRVNGEHTNPMNWL